MPRSRHSLQRCQQRRSQRGCVEGEGVVSQASLTQGCRNGIGARFLCADVVGVVCHYLPVLQHMLLRLVCRDLDRDVAYYYSDPVTAVDGREYGLIRLKFKLAKRYPQFSSSEQANPRNISPKCTLLGWSRYLVLPTDEVTQVLVTAPKQRQSGERLFAERRGLAGSQTFCGSKCHRGTCHCPWFCSWPNKDKLRYIGICGHRALKQIPDACLSGLHGVQTVDLSGCLHLETIGKLFLSECSQLKALRLPYSTYDIDPALTVEQEKQQQEYPRKGNEGSAILACIDSHFLNRCRALESFHCDDAFEHVKSIGNHCMAACSSLTTVSLGGLKALESIGDGFLQDCGRLTTLTFGRSGLRSVRCIGSRFLAGCHRLEAISFSGMGKLERLSDRFCFQTGIRTVTFCGLQKVQRIPDDFFAECHKLTEISFEGLETVTEIGDRFFAEAKTLPMLDLHGLAGVSRVEDYAFADCPMLKEVKGYRAMENLLSIGEGFLSNAKSLKTFSFEGPFLLKADAHLLEGCTSLMQVELRGLGALETLPNSFLCGCSRLEFLNFRGLEGQVAAIEENCCAGCERLAVVDLTGLEGVARVGSGFLMGCHDISVIRVPSDASFHSALIDPLQGEYADFIQTGEGTGRCDE